MTWGFVTANKPPIVTEFLLNKFVKNSGGIRGPVDPAEANKSGGGIGFDKCEDLFDDIFPPEEQSWSCRGDSPKLLPHRIVYPGVQTGKPKTQLLQGTESPPNRTWIKHSTHWRRIWDP